MRWVAYFHRYMMSASTEDIRKELQKLPPKKVLDLTLRLARFKKENKELLTYLLFEAGDEQGYVHSLRLEIDALLADVQKAPSATIKKQLRRVTRLITRQSKYIGSKWAAVDLHLYFCNELRSHPDQLLKITSANTIFHQQLNKAAKLLPALEADLQYDYQQQLESLSDIEAKPKKTSRWWRRKSE